jgi:hypothetical protein
MENLLTVTGLGIAGAAGFPLALLMARLCLKGFFRALPKS